MTVWIIISFWLIGLSLVYLWIVQARLDRIKERTEKIEKDLKRRRLTYKKAKANVLRQMQAEKKAKEKLLNWDEQEEFNLFKKLIINSGSIEINGTKYFLKADGKRFMNGNTFKVYPLNEQGWRDWLDDYYESAIRK